ncbi:MAG: F0F1 ATP synthase subunit delta [Rhodobacterales bacterium]|nr:F0F1 ATP synthase subunit delta [Rhodobacterales bacterium]
MSDTSSISSGVAARYAPALFDLAKEADKLPAIEADLDTLDVALTNNESLRDLFNSPVYSRDELMNSVSALSAKMKLSSIVSNTLGLMAQKRRLQVVPMLIDAVRTKISDEKGEVTAEVTAAQKLSSEQIKELSETLKSSVGKNVNIKATIDESLIGGLIVKVGSKMIDSSIRSKLSNLQNVMKEVG